jgi:hypothetical protein
MTDLDEGLRHTILSLAERMPTTNLAETGVRLGERRRVRRRSALAAAGVSVAVAAVVIPIGFLGGSSGPSGSAGLSQGGARAAVVAPGGIPGPFDVAPAPVTIVGGADTARRACRPAEISGNATLRRAPGGVVGVVNLTSASNCDIDLGAIHPTLLDQQGQPLALTQVANADSNNPAANAGWIPRTSFGFAWNGSWCGQPATSVQVPLKHGSVEVPLAGPQPGCSGASTSVVIPGAAGYPGNPVQGAPPAWRFLTVTLAVAPATNTSTLHGLRLTFTNNSAQPVRLAPTPTYFIGVRDTYGDGTQGEANHLLVIKSGLDIVPAHGTLRVSLPPESIVQDFNNLRGPTATITFEMAGVPTASATTRIAH